MIIKKKKKQTRRVVTSMERRVIQLKWGSLGTSSYGQCRVSQCKD